MFIDKLETNFLTEIFKYFLFLHFKYRMEIIMKNLLQMNEDIWKINYEYALAQKAIL